MKETLIFLNFDDSKETLKLPEDCEGIYCPFKFSSSEYIQWKSKLSKSSKQEFLIEKHEQDYSIYSEIYEAIYNNFITASDKEFMVYTRFLVDPRELSTFKTALKKNPLYIEDDDTEPEFIYPAIDDSMARFSGPYSKLYGDFIRILRKCLFENDNAPKEIEESIKDNLDTIDLGNHGEYSLTLDSINKKSWEILSRWEVIRNFIENNKKDFPDILRLIEVYGEPFHSKKRNADFLFRDGEYVDLVDAEYSDFIVSSLTENFSKEKIIKYDLQN